MVLAAGVLVAGFLAFSFAYAGTWKVEGEVVAPWLGYLNTHYVPFERLLSGALWLFVVVELCAGRLGEPLDRFHPAVRTLVTSFAAGLMFYVLRDTTIALGDGPSLVRDPQGAVITGGYYTFVEELVGMWLPLRIARMYLTEGRSPVAAIVLGYRVVSIAFGMLYVGTVATFVRRVAAPRLAALLLLSHAAMLMFMGYVENYVGAFALLAVGFLIAIPRLSSGTLTPRHTLAVTALFALAAMFHGVAVWAVFSLVLLAFATNTERAGWTGRARVIVANVALGLGIIVGVYLLFRYYVTPGVGPVHLEPLVGESRRPNPFANSWEELGQIRPVHEHALALLRVGAPSLLVFLAAIAASPRQVLAVFKGRDVHFALLFLLGFLVHQLVWRSGLGIYRDWDLFAFTTLPLVYLATRVVALLPRHPAIYGLVFGSCVLAGLSWSLAQSAAPFPACESGARPWGDS
ncbi:MAG TPA: hypothetical protein VFX59_30300 [Polyangiales bacterium]|nr:hypothetical protein [Polyangiales bacterium]